jgi:hypothetical protein
MKTVSLLAVASLASLTALVVGIALDFGAGPIFALTMITLILLLWAGDYRPYHRLREHFLSHLP